MKLESRNDSAGVNPYEAPALQTPAAVLLEPVQRFLLRASTGPIDPTWIRSVRYKSLGKVFFSIPFLVLIVVIAALSLRHFNSPVAALFSFTLLLTAQFALVVFVLEFVKFQLAISEVPTQCKIAQVTLKGYSDRFRLNAPDYEQLSVWPIVSSAFEFRQFLLVFGQSLLSRTGLALKPVHLESSFEMSQLVNNIVRLIGSHSRTNFGSELIAQREFEFVHFEKPLAVFRGHVLSSQFARNNRANWWISGFQFAWLHLTIGCFFVACLIVAFRQFSAVEAFYIPLLVSVGVILPIWSWIKNRHSLMRFLALYSSPNACVSRYELLISEEGFETRSNASQVRCRWPFFRNPLIEQGKVTAECRITNTRVPLFNRELLSSNEDWDAVSSLAMKSIAKTIAATDTDHTTPTIEPSESHL